MVYFSCLYLLWIFVAHFYRWSCKITSNLQSQLLYMYKYTKHICRCQCVFDFKILFLLYELLVACFKKNSFHTNTDKYTWEKKKKNINRSRKLNWSEPKCYRTKIYDVTAVKSTLLMHYSFQRMMNFIPSATSHRHTHTFV